jgi:glutaredoxin
MYKLFSSNNCSGCAQVKAALKEKGVSFVEYNISVDEDYKAFVLSQGHRSVPVLYNDNQYIATGAVSIIKEINGKSKH